MLKRAILAMVIGAMLAVGTALAFTEKASASHNWVWAMPRMASNTICVQNHTPWDWRAYYSVVDWDKARDLRVVWKHAYGKPYPEGRCRGFTSVIMILRKDELVNTGAVAETANWQDPYRRYVHIDQQLFPGYSPANRQHIISHELGHGFGLGHNTSWSMMTGGWPAPQWVQSIDFQAINTRY